MKKEAEKIFFEIKCKLGYYLEVLKDKPYLIENLVIIIPSEQYEILANEAVNYYMVNEAIFAKFDSIMGHKLKIVDDIDKIYIALDLIYPGDNQPDNLICEKEGTP